jgi:heat shock protein HspQ
MIKSICLLTGHKCLLSYDGKKFEAIGSSPVAEGITNNSKNKDGLFYKLMKEAEDDFEPVEYWYSSSMNFADEDPPKPYSDELFELLKEELSMLEKEKS